MAKELYELINTFRGTAQIEDTVDALKVSCFLRKLQINGLVKEICFEDMNESYFDCLYESVENVECLPFDFRELMSCLNLESYSILNRCVKETTNYSNIELIELAKELLSDDTNFICSMKYRFNYTEDGISKLVNYLAKDKNYNSVLDLCSGKGSFLIQNLLNENRNKLVGYELVTRDVLFSKMMAYVLDGNIEIHNVDVLQNTFDEKFDLCFTECPLALRYKQKIVEDPNGLLGFDHFGARVDWAFVFKAINAMNQNGKTFAILSQNSLINSTDMKSRQIIIDNKLLEKVILMPRGTLKNSGVGYSLLVFSNNNDEVKFVDARNCYKNGKRIKQFDVEAFKKVENKLTYTFSYKEVEERDYSFELTRYLYEIGIPEAMNPVMLSECADVIGGYVYNTRKKIDSPVSVKMIKVENFDGCVVDTAGAQEVEIEESKVSNYLVQKGDILLASKGTVIRAAIVQNIDEPCIFNSNINIIRVKEGANLIPEFLLSYLNSDLWMKQLMLIQTGDIVKNISLKALREMDVPMLDMDTQEVIEVRFNKLQQKLVEAKKALAEYENKINGLFDMEVSD